MITTFDGGIELILWLQQFSPAFDQLFIFFTLLGNETFFLVALPTLYWCFDRRIGARLVILFLFSIVLNSWAKLLADQPRPFEYDPRVRALVAIDTGGFPSGHTQSAVVVWGYLATQIKRRWFWGIAILLMICIPLSRLYLGVHFPIDIVGGYAIGLVLLLLYLWGEPAAEAWVAKQPLAGQLGLAVALPLLLFWSLPAVDHNAIAAAATLLGMGVGLALERRWVRFETNRVWRTNLLRLLVGMVGVAVFYLGLRVAFAGLEPEPLWRFVRYASLGLWCAWGAPWLFIQLRLASSENGPSTPP